MIFSFTLHCMKLQQKLRLSLHACKERWFFLHAYNVYAKLYNATMLHVTTCKRYINIFQEIWQDVCSILVHL